MRFDAIIFDFDGVLLESEFEGNQMLARLLTEIGHPTSLREAVEHFTGLNGRDFIDAVEKRIGRPLPSEFHEGPRSHTSRGYCRGRRRRRVCSWTSARISQGDRFVEFVSLGADPPRSSWSS